MDPTFYDITKEAVINEAVRIMKETESTVMAVTNNEDKLEGIVHYRDLVETSEENKEMKTVEDLMIKDPPFLLPSDTLQKGLETMVTSGLSDVIATGSSANVMLYGAVTRAPGALSRSDRGLSPVEWPRVPTAGGVARGSANPLRGLPARRLAPRTGLLAGLGHVFFFPPLGPFEMLHGYPPLRVIQAVELYIALIALLVGYRTRAAGWAVGLTQVVLAGLRYSTGKIDHELLVFIVPVAIFLVVGCGPLGRREA